LSPFFLGHIPYLQGVVKVAVFQRWVGRAIWKNGIGFKEKRSRGKRIE
jgi:hypothetical protein